MTKQFLFFLQLTLSITIYGQTLNPERDSLKKDLEGKRKQFYEEYKRTIIDSTVFTGQLINMTFGGTCGASPGAGMFIFKVISTETKIIPDTVAVIVQCARGYYENKVQKGKFYKLKVTPNHLSWWVLVKWDEYEKVPRYFIMHDEIVQVN